MCELGRQASKDTRDLAFQCARITFAELQKTLSGSLDEAIRFVACVTEVELD